jgi:hypothetical protein
MLLTFTATWCSSCESSPKIDLPHPAPGDFPHQGVFAQGLGLVQLNRLLRDHWRCYPWSHHRYLQIIQWSAPLPGALHNGRRLRRVFALSLHHQRHLAHLHRRGILRLDPSRDGMPVHQRPAREVLNLDPARSHPHQRMPPRDALARNGPHIGGLFRPQNELGFPGLQGAQNSARSVQG